VTELLAALAALKSVSDAMKAGIDLTAEARKKHADELDAAFDAIVEHMKTINAAGPTPPPGPIQKG
jgi:hypothetical protein